MCGSKSRKGKEESKAGGEEMKEECGHGINRQAYPMLIVMVVYLGVIWILLPLIFTILGFLK